MKSVHELSQDELEELRESYFYQLLETDEEILGDIEYPHEIPMANIIAHYEHISFVEEDFFCNLVADEEPLFMCNCCHDHFTREEMDFDVDDDQDLCKNCNYKSYNEAPYGQD